LSFITMGHLLNVGGNNSLLSLEICGFPLQDTSKTMLSK
jgi:hypothetical protein